MGWISKENKVTIGIILFYLFFVALGLIFSDPPEGLLRKVFDFFYHATNLRSKIDVLESRIRFAENQLESKTITLLTEIKEVAKESLIETSRIIETLKYKRKWREEYAESISKLEERYSANKNAADLIHENLKFIKSDTKRRDEFFDFRLRLLYANNDNHRLSQKLLSLPDWIPPVHINASKPLDDTVLDPDIFEAFATIGGGYVEAGARKFDDFSKLMVGEFGENVRPYLEKLYRQIRDEYDFEGMEAEESREIAEGSATSRFRQRSPKSPTTNETGVDAIQHRNGIEENTNPRNIYVQPKLDLGGTNSNLTLKEKESVPNKRKSPYHERIIKASPEFYQQILRTNMDIGKKGELLVLDYEKQRLIAEGLRSEEKLEHSSVIVGDGLGYDIRSFNDGKDIYIEVKTTTGDFWSGLFFSQKEYQKMHEFNEQYYLYRVCNYDTDDNTGDLFIYSGKEIVETFDFNSKMYVLTEKTRSDIE